MSGGRYFWVRGWPHFSRAGRTRFLLPAREVFRPRTFEQAVQIARIALGGESEQATLGEHDEARVHEFAEALLGESMVICRLERARQLYAEPSIEPLVPPDDDDPRPPIERPSWIALLVLHESGASLAGVHLQLTAPDGSMRYGQLDGEGRWRADDVPKGTCTLRLGDDLADACRRPKGAAVSPQPDDQWIGPDPARLRLVTTREHRIVVVDGRTEIFLVDSAGKPIADRACTARVGERTLEGRTDEDGGWRYFHPGSIETHDVILGEFDAPMVSLTRDEALDA